MFIEILVRCEIAAPIVLGLAPLAPRKLIDVLPGAVFKNQAPMISTIELIEA